MTAAPRYATLRSHVRASLDAGCSGTTNSNGRPRGRPFFVAGWVVACCDLGEGAVCGALVGKCGCPAVFNNLRASMMVDTKMPNNFSLTEFGSSWPSGKFLEIAMIDASCEEIESAVCSALLEGHEEGMGSWKAVGIRLDAGEIVELIRYEYDSDRAFMLRVDSKVDFHVAIKKILALLGKDENFLKWISPLVE